MKVKWFSGDGVSLNQPAPCTCFHRVLGSRVFPKIAKEPLMLMNQRTHAYERAYGADFTFVYIQDLLDSFGSQTMVYICCEATRFVSLAKM
jgi:hypothetical protein